MVMRIGLLSDIHGNLAALRAVAAALRQEAPLDETVVAGDHLQGGPRPVAVWETLAASGWKLVRGNEDLVLVDEHCSEVGRSHPYARAYRLQHAWTRTAVGPAILQALEALPPARRLATPAGDLLVVHSSPRDVDDRCGAPHNTAADVTAAYAGTGAAAIAFGHYHQSFVRPMPFALLLNVASVGLPVDRRPLAAYTILTATPDGWVVEQRRVPYDAAEEARAAGESGLPPWVPDAA